MNVQVIGIMGRNGFCSWFHVCAGFQELRAISRSHVNIYVPSYRTQNDELGLTDESSNTEIQREAMLCYVQEI